MTATETTDCRIRLSKDTEKKNYGSYVWKNKAERNTGEEKSYKIIKFIKKEPNSISRNIAYDHWN